MIILVEIKVKGVLWKYVKTASVYIGRNHRVEKLLSLLM